MAGLRRWLAAAAAVGLVACGQIAPAANAQSNAVEQAVIVAIKLSDNKFGASGESFALYEVEDALEARVLADGVGETDGHEIGEGFFTIYFYGPDAEALWTSIAKAVPATTREGSYATIRAGPPGATERRVALPLPPS
jgi:hypothetical protein